MLMWNFRSSRHYLTLRHYGPALRSSFLPFDGSTLHPSQYSAIRDIVRWIAHEIILSLAWLFQLNKDLFLITLRISEPAQRALLGDSYIASVVGLESERFLLLLPGGS